jgi:hypothetical protein
MRRVAIIILSFGLLILSLVVGGPVASGKDQDVVGSWRLTITDPSAPQGQQTSPSLSTFFADGTFIASDLPLSPAPAGAPFKFGFASAGHGVWVAKGDGHVDLTFLQLAASEVGQFVGTATVSASCTLDATGDALSGTYSLAVVTPDGTQVGSGTGPFAGTRIQLVPMASPAASPAA